MLFQVIWLYYDTSTFFTEFVRRRTLSRMLKIGYCFDNRRIMTNFALSHCRILANAACNVLNRSGLTTYKHRKCTKLVRIRLLYFCKSTN